MVQGGMDTMYDPTQTGTVLFIWDEASNRDELLWWMCTLKCCCSADLQGWLATVTCFGLGRRDTDKEQVANWATTNICPPNIEG